MASLLVEIFGVSGDSLIAHLSERVRQEFEAIFPNEPLRTLEVMGVGIGEGEADSTSVVAELSDIDRDKADHSRFERLADGIARATHRSRSDVVFQVRLCR